MQSSIPTIAAISQPRDKEQICTYVDIAASFHHHDYYMCKIENSQRGTMYIGEEKVLG